MNEQKLIMKLESNYKIIRDWLMLKLLGRGVNDYFIKNKYLKIVIYGGGDIGQLLVEELAESKITVLYIIDQNSENLFLKAPVMTLQQIPKHIFPDAVIVTPTFAFEDIKNNLEEIISSPIISFEDVIRET